MVSAARYIASRRIPIRPHILIGCAIIVGATGLLIAEGPEDHLLRVLALMVVVAAMMLAAVLRFLVPWQARKHFRELAAAKGAISFNWDENGVSFSGAKGATRLDWTDFHRWGETDSVLILMQSSMLYNLAPKRVLSDEQQAEVRGHLDAVKVKKIRD